MIVKNHYAFDSTKQNLKQAELVRLLEEEWLLREAGKSGYLFSEYTLKKYLDLEFRLGEKVLTSGEDSLLTKSTGERKKLLLNYQLAQKPDFLILDHPFDGLDSDTVARFKEQFKALAETTTFIQFFTRSEDRLAFCNTALDFQDGHFVKSGALELADATQNTITEQKIPRTLVTYPDVPEVLIDFRDVSVAFGDKPVLQNIVWQIRKSESWQLTGVNGSGKTTLLSMITGDSVKGYGKELYIFGSKKGSGESVWEIKKRIGYVTPVLTERFDGMHSVSDMITGGIYDSVGLYRRPTTLERKIAEEWIQLIGLEDKAQMRFRDLSEVDKRLVLIARAMIKNPPLLILDEPTFALGDADAALVVSLINTLSKGSDVAIIFVSHRREPGLQVSKVYRLLKGDEGSLGTEYDQEVR
ncbi:MULTISPECIES: ATP-binding cassette domain-containing protein [unclassified Leeuwenhoekiella]|uniref:ATP-binding cassette domain-containing protein n=1 Tax=unclassified Leeuwenhoekiella TaxID=2615029 RepID=UPI000C4179A7|nr:MULTISPECIES: ATP-binding cassette domain-containing protein [unclassified Leeuwenhoekiella]MAW95605.1 ABC transporter [Leeuwenhoekiella sp.]MBA82303.1 ABC transporter [Leeuwenhoekiella sp.]|tara:strand:- start:43036 stop:44274 length:1239 start_codon:yes stop_codon:yes gene_type:complete